MMADAGESFEQAFSTTVLMSAIGTAIMALYAKFPVAMAPGMSVNALVCYTAVLEFGFTWEESLFAVVLSGLVFFTVTVTGLRKWVLDAVPVAIKAGIVAGIGCFIAFIGLQKSGIIVGDDSTLISLGDISDPSVLLALICIFVTIVLVSRKVPLAVMGGMIFTFALGVIMGVVVLPDALFAIPELPDPGRFINGIDGSIMCPQFFILVFVLAFVEFFDGSGTLMAVGYRSNLTDSEQYGRAMNVDAAVASISGTVGCTPTVVVAESAVGIEAGARTGFAAAVIALLLLLSVFLHPLYIVVGYECAVGAMVFVAVELISELRLIDWNDLPSKVTVFGSVMMTMLSFSITDGLAFGVILYVASMLGSGRGREVRPLLYVIAAMLMMYQILFAISF